MNDVPGFDEAWYRRQYPGVARAIERGKVASGKAYYLWRGKQEGKFPNPRLARAAGVRIAGEFEPPYLGRPQNVDPSLPLAYEQHNGGAFLAPDELAVTTVLPRHVALIGSCMLTSWQFHTRNTPDCAMDHFLVNVPGDLPEFPPSPYDLQVVQVPIRGLVPQGFLSGLDTGSADDHEAMFQHAVEALDHHLRLSMLWNTGTGLLTFVVNFLIPQRNPLGMLFPRFDLRNPEYFVSRLNQELERLARAYTNTYILDVDRLVASIGRRYVQDDVMEQFAHGSVIGMGGVVTARIEPLAPTASHFDLRPWRMFRDAVWAELVAMFRVVRQADAVKLVVVDLDDTLWRGVSGDTADIGPEMAEGWPLGLAEALRYLKKRGILLAIISRNEESRIRAIWDRIMQNHLSLLDFAAVIINWQPKPDNMWALLDDVALLPRAVVFIDDNPAERAAMSLAFPDMRVIGRHPYYLRSTLLWAPETQVPTITQESGRRTEMVHAQLRREGERRHLSRDAFLSAAAPSVAITVITDPDHPRYARAFELLNKTNQYNTTGRRWTAEALATLLRGGACLYCFDAEDRYTAYGLVGVVIVEGTHITQWVMSCRILGYRIEDAVMAELVSTIRAGQPAEIDGTLVETDVNFPCRTLFQQCGFVRDGDRWVLPADHAVPAPAHVTLRTPDTPA